MMVKTEEILGKVQDVLIEALGVDDDEVTPEATLSGDLGAESIDYLDIVFRLQKSFNIEIPRGELFPENIAAADSSFVQDGVVTDAGITMLREKLPHADVDSFAADPKVSNVADLFTVQMIVNFLERKLGES